MASLRDRKKKRSTYFLWRLSYWGLLAFEGLLRIVPLTVLYTIGRGIGSALHFFSRKYRRIVQRNLRIVLYHQSLPPVEIAALAKESICLSCANLLCALKTALISPEKLGRHVELDLDRQPSRKEGLIVLISHMGNWELLAQLAHFLGERAGGFGTHFRPLNNPFIDAHIRKRRGRVGVRLFAKRESALGLAKFIDAGGALGILSDQRVGQKGTQTTLFGRATTITPLPTLLARRTGANFVATALTTTGRARWEFEVIPVPSADTADVAKGVETAILRNPQDGFWLHDRFKLSRQNPLTYKGRSPQGETSMPTTPVRVLVVKTSEPEDLPILQPIVPLLRCEYIYEGTSPEALPLLPEAQKHSYKDPTVDQILELDASHALAFDLIVTTGTPNDTIKTAARKLGVRAVPYHSL